MLSFSFTQHTKSDAFPGQNALLKDLPQTEGVAQIATKFVKRGALHPKTHSFADALQVVEAVLSQNDDVMAAVIVTHGTGFKVYFRKTPPGESNKEYLTRMGHNKKKSNNATLLIKII